MDSQKEYWANKEKEVEERFLELEEEITCAVQKPEPKKKGKEGRRKNQIPLQNMQLSFKSSSSLEKANNVVCCLLVRLESPSKVQEKNKNSFIIYVNLSRICSLFIRFAVIGEKLLTLCMRECLRKMRIN